MNISSFADSPRHIKKKLFKLLENNKIHLIGSDCHNLTSRPPEYGEGIAAIRKKVGDEAVDRLIQNANRLVK